MKRPWGNRRIWNQWGILEARIRRKIDQDIRRGRTPRYVIVGSPTTLPFEFPAQPSAPPPP